MTLPQFENAEVAVWRLHWSRMVGAADKTKKLDAFCQVVEEGAHAAQIRPHLKAPIADAVSTIASNHHNFGRSVDEIQKQIADAFDGKINGRAATINGRAATMNGGSLSDKRVAILVRGDQVPLKSLHWAWKHRFAYGKLALLAGDPGLGKSQLALDVIARLTTGDLWPVDGGRAQACEAIVLTAEDGLSDTVAPRLVAAGADMSKVHFLTGTKIKGGDEELFDLTRDVAVLRDVLSENPNVKVIDIDPLTAYLGETQAQRNSQVRKALAPLVRLIEDTDVLVIGVTHLNKSQGKAIYRVLDSIAFVALGRILHLVIADTENPDIRKFLCDKTNIGPKPPGLTFLCQQVPVVTRDGEEWVSRISWGTQHINETADQALGAETVSADGATAKDDAIQFLTTVLAGGPHLVNDLNVMARSAGLLSEEQLISQSKPFRSARKTLGIEPYQKGFGSDCKWYWALPASAPVMPSPPSDALPFGRASLNSEGITGATMVTGNGSGQRVEVNPVAGLEPSEDHAANGGADPILPENRWR